MVGTQKKQKLLDCGFSAMERSFTRDIFSHLIIFFHVSGEHMHFFPLCFWGKLIGNWVAWPFNSSSGCGRTLLERNSRGEAS